MSAGNDLEWAGLAYGAMERLLANLHQAAPESIRTRFRKLRLRPFPDEIRSGTGVRISYDLPRVLALTAVFELSRLYIPQGQAVEMIEAVWPEWCRVCLAAAVSASVIPQPFLMPSDASSLLGIAPDAFEDGDIGSGSVSVLAPNTAEPDVPVPPVIVLDAQRTIQAVVAAAGSASIQPLRLSFTRLERAFGWTDPDLPHRSSVADLGRGRGFLDEGPYFARAEMLLQAADAAFDAERRPLSWRRLQWLLSYIEDPAPIDRWKGEVGYEEARPRLKHLISAWATDRGLKVSRPFPETMGLMSGDDAGELALSYIRAAQEKGRRA